MVEAAPKTVYNFSAGPCCLPKPVQMLPRRRAQPLRCCRNYSPLARPTKLPSAVFFIRFLEIWEIYVFSMIFINLQDFYIKISVIHSIPAHLRLKIGDFSSKRWE